MGEARFTPGLSERQLDTLAALDIANRNIANVAGGDGWAKPMDCGAFNGSHHSGTLQTLVRKGLADRKGYFAGSRHVWRYLITSTGRAALRLARGEEDGE